jgi:polyphosphate kinase
MPRNLDRRVEILVPVLDPTCVEQLVRILDVVLADQRLAWTLDATGTWHKVPVVNRVDADGELERPVDAHRVLQEVARGRTRRHELDEALPEGDPARVRWRAEQ